MGVMKYESVKDANTLNGNYVMASLKISRVNFSKVLTHDLIKSSHYLHEFKSDGRIMIVSSTVINEIGT